MSDDIPTAAQLRDNLRQRIEKLERERDEARAAYCALRDDVQRMYVAGNCETHCEDDWWWCDAIAGINCKKGILHIHSDKPEWRSVK